MLTSLEDRAKVRAAAAAYFTTLPDGDGRSMLGYTINLQDTWNDLLIKLPLNASSSVLDVGCGFGILALEIAMTAGSSVTGSDINPEFIEGAKSIQKMLISQGNLADSSRVSFETDDIMTLSESDCSHDVIVVREVFSYVSKPDLAMDHLARIVKPGGVVCVEDIDDRLYFTFPPASKDFDVLFQAVRELQASRGGDREVGRKLSVYLHNAGFEVTNVITMTEPMHVNADPAKGERQFIINQLSTLKTSIVKAGLLSEPEFDGHIKAMQEQAPSPEFRMNGRIAVFATKAG